MRSEAWRSPVVLATLAMLCCCSPPAAQGEKALGELVLERVKFGDDLGKRAHAHVAKLVGFGERYSGTPGWRQSLDYLAKQLTELGLEVERDRWHDAKENVEFENVVGRLHGRSSERIVLGAHHDTKRCAGHDDPAHNFLFLGANDSGSGCGLLLALAEDLKKRDNPASFDFVFFDGEESMTWDWNGGARALFGSRRFAARERELVVGKPKPRIATFILLDMVGAKDLQLDDETNSDPELKRIFRAAAKACGHESYFFQKQQSVSDDHLPFLDLGIRSIDLVDLFDNPQWHTKDDVLEHISDKSLQIVGEVVLTALPEIERSYLTVKPVASRPTEKR